MTSLKSIMERRALQVLDVRSMKNLKGGKKERSRSVQSGGGLPPNTDGGDE